jgi:RNA polymerase sigma factor (sigma-70 family)
MASAGSMRFDEVVDRAQETDAQLVQRIRAGDQSAWRDLVDRFSRYVYAIAVQAYRLPEHDAEDVFQEVFTRVYERLDQLRDPSAVRPWIAQLTRRVALDRLREGSRVVLNEELLLGGADDSMDRLEEAWDVREAMSALSEPCREVLDRFFARDESYRTIGDALDIPSGTIASRISRCLGQLREQYEGRIEGRTASGGRIR